MKSVVPEYDLIPHFEENDISPFDNKKDIKQTFKKDFRLGDDKDGHGIPGKKRRFFDDDDYSRDLDNKKRKKGQDDEDEDKESKDKDKESKGKGKDKESKDKDKESKDKDNDDDDDGGGKEKDKGKDKGKEKEADKIDEEHAESFLKGLKNIPKNELDKIREIVQNKLEGRSKSSYKEAEGAAGKEHKVDLDNIKNEILSSRGRSVGEGGFSSHDLEVSSDFEPEEAIYDFRGFKPVIRVLESLFTGRKNIKGFNQPFKKIPGILYSEKMYPKLGRVVIICDTSGSMSPTLYFLKLFSTMFYKFFIELKNFQGVTVYLYHFTTSVHQSKIIKFKTRSDISKLANAIMAGYSVSGGTANIDYVINNIKGNYKAGGYPDLVFIFTDMETSLDGGRMDSRGYIWMKKTIFLNPVYAQGELMSATLFKDFKGKYNFLRKRCFSTKELIKNK